MKPIHTYQIGEVLAALYDEYLETYRDDQVAQIAAIATLNDLILRSRGQRKQRTKRLMMGPLQEIPSNVAA